VVGAPEAGTRWVCTLGRQFIDRVTAWSKVAGRGGSSSGLNLKLVPRRNDRIAWPGILSPAHRQQNIAPDHGHKRTEARDVRLLVCTVRKPRLLLASGGHGGWSRTMVALRSCGPAVLLVLNPQLIPPPRRRDDQIKRYENIDIQMHRDPVFAIGCS
jgi:hypothetical protein